MNIMSIIIKTVITTIDLILMLAVMFNKKDDSIKTIPIVFVCANLVGIWL